jgi:hypothetical protein
MNKALCMGLLFLALTFFLQAQQAPGKLMAGAAEASINPPAGSYMAGYGYNRKSTAIHDNIFVKAVAASNNNNAIVFVVIDCIGLPYPIVQTIREYVEKKIPPSHLDPAHIIISSTHTHAGPDVIGIWGADQQSSGIDDSYISSLINTTEAVIVKAWKSRQTAIAKYADADYGEGWVKNVSDSTEVDRQVGVIQFLSTNNKNIATLTNFACHPTILGGTNTLISADFPSGFYKQMRAKKGGVNLFLQGAIGGWVQPDNIPRTFEEAEQRGAGLADAAITALKNAKNITGTDINFRSKIFEMPVHNEAFGQLSAAGILRRDIGEGTLTEIAWFSIGNAVFATHPGETSPLFSFNTKKLMKNTGPKFIIGLGMDELGYIIKPAFFTPGCTLHATPYLISMSPGKEAGETMMEVLTDLSGQ